MTVIVQIIVIFGHNFQWFLLKPIQLKFIKSVCTYIVRYTTVQYAYTITM